MRLCPLQTDLACLRKSKMRSSKAQARVCCLGQQVSFLFICEAGCLLAPVHTTAHYGNVLVARLWHTLSAPLVVTAVLHNLKKNRRRLTTEVRAFHDQRLLGWVFE